MITFLLWAGSYVSAHRQAVMWLFLQRKKHGLLSPQPLPASTIFFLLLFLPVPSKAVCISWVRLLSPPLSSPWPFLPSRPLKLLQSHSVLWSGLHSHLAQPSAALDTTGHSLLLEHHLLFLRLWDEYPLSRFPPEPQCFLKLSCGTLLFQLPRMQLRTEPLCFSFISLFR